jgi:putative endonuclease
MFCVYCLYSSKFDKIYIGYTSGLIDRFWSHNEFATKGYTIRYRPWIVAYVEFCDTKIEALHREKQLKTSKGRAFLKGYIQKYLDQ